MEKEMDIVHLIKFLRKHNKVYKKNMAGIEDEEETKFIKNSKFKLLTLDLYAEKDSDCDSEASEKRNRRLATHEVEAYEMFGRKSKQRP